MFDIGWPELVIILIVAIVVVGPRDLPKAFYTVGKWVKAARRVTSDFQRHVDDMVRETELEDLKKVANQARSLNVKSQIEKAIDPTGDIKNALDLDAATGGKPGASSAASTSTASENSIATPSISTPSVPVETKAEPKTGTAATAAPAKQAAKKAAARKPSPRVASRVPKRAANSSTASKAPTSKAPTSKAASKAPNSEKTS
jgi:sec-independent protein translocase protein TatB